MTSSVEASGDAPAVLIENEDGRSPIILLCDHASNRMPSPYDVSLGVSDADKQAHIAWDPGALGVSRALSQHLDAPLIHSTISRLIIDCNRAEDAPDLIPARSEMTAIPGNAALSEGERVRRLDLAHRPFHAAIEAALNKRREDSRPAALVSVHSYTPVYNGIHRPWEIGLISGDDRRLSDPVLADLRARTAFQVGDNQPYSPADRVYYTLHRHGESVGLPSLMIEIRNDEITTPDEEQEWADLLAPMLSDATGTVLAENTGGVHA